MILLNAGAALVISYLLGAIPFGLLIVKIATGKDIRKIESGRTGGTNTMRAAGLFAGILTVFLDMVKGVATLWVTDLLTPGDPWVKTLAALLAIIGHNYSIYLIERNDKGHLTLRGGAGGSTCLGGAIALWTPSILIILPLAILVFIFIGYASVTTMSIAFFATMIFVVKAILEGYPWQYIIFGVASEALLLWALRPNIKRLIEGTERPVGLRSYLRKRKAAQQNNTQEKTN